MFHWGQHCRYSNKLPTEGEAILSSISTTLLGATDRLHVAHEAGSTQTAHWLSFSSQAAFRLIPVRPSQFGTLKNVHLQWWIVSNKYPKPGAHLPEIFSVVSNLLKKCCELIARSLVLETPLPHHGHPPPLCNNNLRFETEVVRGVMRAVKADPSKYGWLPSS